MTKSHEVRRSDVGHRSLVVTDRRLPKGAILSVDHELRERVEVRILRQP